MCGLAKYLTGRKQLIHTGPREIHGTSVKSSITMSIHNVHTVSSQAQQGNIIMSSLKNANETVCLFVV